MDRERTDNTDLHAAATARVDVSEIIENQRRGSPKAAVLGLWGVVLFASLIGAEHIRDEVLKSDALAKSPAVRSALSTWVALKRSLGLDAIAEGMHTLRAKVYTPREIWRAETGPVPARAQPAAAEGTHRGPASKTRVLIVGASSIQFALGVALEKQFQRYEDVRVKRFGQLATGLSRPDFMNWPKKHKSLVESFQPDLVVTNFGGNDAQDIPLGKYKEATFNTPAWDEEYGRRVQEMIQIGRDGHADTVMLGMPIMRSKGFSRKMMRLNQAMARATEAAKGVFVSTWPMSTEPSGAYRKSLRFRGKSGLMRTSDGVHYRPLGARYVVEHVARQLERRFRLVPKDKDLAISERHEMRPPGRTAFSYIAYVPRAAQDTEAKASRWPVLLLLPDPAADWSAWDRHPHRRIQALSQKHQVLVVLPDDHRTWSEKALAQSWLADLKAHLPAANALLVATHQPATLAKNADVARAAVQAGFEPFTIFEPALKDTAWTSERDPTLADAIQRLGGPNSADGSRGTKEAGGEDVPSAEG